MEEFGNIKNFEHFPENMKMLTFDRYDLFYIQLFAQFLSLFTRNMHSSFTFATRVWFS